MSFWNFWKKKDITEVAPAIESPFPQATLPQNVNERAAMALSAVWACVNILAGTIATLPIVVYRTDKNGKRTVAKDHALYQILHNSPNAEQTTVDFWESLILPLEMRGNAFALKQFIGGRLVGIKPIFAPVSIERDAQGRLVYSWSEEGKGHIEYSDRVLHIRGFGGNPRGGISALSAVREVFNLTHSINSSAGKYFGNSMSPSGALTFENWLPDDKRGLIEKKIQEKYMGAVNFGVPLVLEGGTKWQPFTINPEDMQMLQSRAWQLEEIARIFSVPPHMIGYTEKQTSWGTGVAVQTLGFQKFSLNRRLKRIEAALMKQLLTPADVVQGIVIEFNLEGLLRGSSQERAAFYQIMAANGFMSINEVRALENYEPVPGGELPRVQMQNVPIDQAIEEDPQEEPTETDPLNEDEEAEEDDANKNP